MPDLGLRNPRRNTLICAGVTLAAWVSVAWGAFEMHRTGEETLGSGLKIGAGLVLGILGPAATYNFWLGMKVFRAIRRGENEVGRWTVTAAELTEFLAGEDARNALGGGNGNLWAPPREPPPEGLEIIFGTDGVVAGEVYFPLVTTGVMPVIDVRMLSEGAPAIAFQVVTTAPSRLGGQASVDALRFPVPRPAGAGPARVVRHYQRVIAGEVVVNEGFYRGRMRFGLIGAPICFAVAAVGFWVKWTGRDPGGDVSIPLIAVGLLLGIAMLVLALAAWGLGRAQRRRLRAS